MKSYFLSFLTAISLLSCVMYDSINIEANNSDEAIETWIIDDLGEQPTYDDFASLRSRLTLAELNGIEVAIIFKNITHIPDYALYRGNTSSTSRDFSYNSALVAVSGDSVLHIGSNAFCGEEGLTETSAILNLRSINFPNLLTVGYYAFYRCFELVDVDIPSATTISEYAFSNCTSLESIALPSVESIEARAFIRCSSLRSVTVPYSANIDPYAFWLCPLLDSPTYY